MLHDELLAEDLLFEDLILNRVDCLRQTSILLAAFDQGILHLLHRLLPIRDFFLMTLNVTLELLNGDVEVLNLLLQLRLLTVLPFKLLHKLQLLGVQLANAHLKFADSRL